MTGDPNEPRCDWLQQARIEISSNVEIIHDEIFVKMVTVEDIINRLSEERQRCYRAHSDAETRQQEPSDPCIKCVVLPKYPECPTYDDIKVPPDAQRRRRWERRQVTGKAGCASHPLALQVLAGPVIEELEKRDARDSIHGVPTSQKKEAYNEAIQLLKEGVKKA